MKVKLLAGTAGNFEYHRYEKYEEAESAANTFAEQGVKATIFTDVPTLAKAATGPVMAAIYNHISPVKIKKFKNNTIAATRLIALLEPIETSGPLTFVPEVLTAASEQPDGPEAEAAASAAESTAADAAESGDDDMAAKKKKAGKAKKAPRVKKAKTERVARTDSKQARLIAMLERASGATVQQMMDEFGWQAHTVRGAIAGAIKKKLGLKVTTEKTEGRGTIYRIA